jgi:hypothetical protein
VPQHMRAERFRDAQLLAHLRTSDAHPACHHGLIGPSSAYVHVPSEVVLVNPAVLPSLSMPFVPPLYA